MSGPHLRVSRVTKHDPEVHHLHVGVRCVESQDDVDEPVILDVDPTCDLLKRQLPERPAEVVELVDVGAPRFARQPETIFRNWQGRAGRPAPRPVSPVELLHDRTE